MSKKIDPVEPPCPRVLVINESDPTGMAGIQGDVKTTMALGGYATTAITSLTAPSMTNILSADDVDPNFIKQQMYLAMDGVKTDAIKLGFLENEAAINAVADVLDDIRDQNIPVVVDPSIMSRSGKVLVDDLAIAAWKRRLYIHAKILTPNLEESQLLGVMTIEDIDDMRQAAGMMRSLGVENIVLKGGPVNDDKELYFVVTENEERTYERARLDTPHTLGAGSAFSSALAVNLARDKEDIFGAVEHSLDFLNQSILHSTGFGYEAGPVNHVFDISQHSSVFHPEDIKIYKT